MSHAHACKMVAYFPASKMLAVNMGSYCTSHLYLQNTILPKLNAKSLNIMPKFSVTDTSQFCLVVYLRGKKFRNSAVIKDKTINSHTNNQRFYKKLMKKK